MWLSKQTRPPAVSAGSDLGVTSISGERAGVVTKGEVRQLPVYGPGGYLWQPAAGQTVLVIKGGTGGEESCVAAAKQGAAPAGMAPGEVFLYAGEGSIHLKNDGSIHLAGAIQMNGGVTLRGRVDVEGPLYINGEPYRPCSCG